MIGLIALLAAAQVVPSISTEQQPDQKIIVNQLPTGDDWKSKTPKVRRMHAAASIEGLKLNPFYAGCKDMTPEAFEKAFEAEVAKSPKSPTITNAALAAYVLCPTGGQ